MNKNILVVCESRKGIGHFKRADKLASILSENNFNVFFLSSYCPRTKNAHVFKLPAYPKPFAYDKNYLQKEKNTQENRISAIKNIIRSTIRFDIIIYEHFPFGKLYLEQEFNLLRRHFSQKGAKFICVIRDIIDELDAQNANECISILNNKFDCLFIFSDETFVSLKLTFPKFSKIKIPYYYLGFLDPGPRKQITIFDGGGSQAYPFYSETLDVLARCRQARPYGIKLFTGNRFSNGNLAGLRNKYNYIQNINIIKYSNNIENEIARSAITISTLGYNTFIDILKYNNYNIVIPWPIDDEQAIRARYLKKIKSNVSVVNFNLNYKINLRKTINNILNNTINYFGMHNFIEHINNL